MPTQSFGQGLVVAALLAALPSCGGGFQGGTAEAFGSFRVDVTNDRAPRIGIELLEEGELSRVLGNAPVEGTTTFRIDLDRPNARHRLRASLLGGEEILSETFVPAELRGVTWILGTNRLTREDASP